MKITGGIDSHCVPAGRFNIEDCKLVSAGH